MATRITQASFTRGELTPRLDSRTNLEQYAIGLKRAKNAIIHQEGGISNRMGLEYCGIAKYNNKHTRCIKFVFNSEQTYMLEFGEKYIRFIKDGGYVIYPDTYGITYEGTYTLSEQKENLFKYTLENDIVIYSQTQLAQDVVCYKNEECTEKFGEITSINTSTSTISVDKDEDKIAQRGEIVEIETPYLAKDLKLIKRSQAGDVLTLTHPDYPVKNLSRYDHHDWKLEDAVFEPSIVAPTGLTAKWTGKTDSNTREYEYLVTAVEEDSNEESKRSESVKVVGHRESNWLTDEYMTLNWNAVKGASEYNIYRNVNGIFGYVGTAQGTIFTDDNIEPDLSSSAPVSKNPFANGNNPSCSAYFQQRKMYGNSKDNPQTLWSSQSGAINNFNVSRPLIATDAVTLNMDDREVNEIRHIIPSKDLIVLTSNSEWKVNGTDGVFQANPMPAAVIQSCYGSSHVEPVVSGAMILFVQAGGAVIRDLGWDELSQGYDGDELSLFSSHLFEGKEIVYMAYAKEPYRILFVVFTDGTAATMTYNKKQKLCGWTTFESDGLFESVDVVREGMEDVAYFVINRTINGENVKFIERTKTRIIEDARKAFLVDCGLSAEFNEPVSTISGLDHLEGKEVIANVNGGIITGLVVKDGKIELPKAAKTITVGLPYEFEFETLNIEGENTQGLKKVINYVSVKVYKSREDFLFCGSNNQEFRHIRCDESINNSGNLFSKDLAMTVLSLPATDATIKLKQNYPLPLTILSVSATVDVQDNENN